MQSVEQVKRIKKSSLSEAKS